MLKALKFGIPYVYYDGAMGLTELAEHLCTIDYVTISGRKSMLEAADSYRENRHPFVIVNAHYVTPTALGCSTDYNDEALEKYTYLGGSCEVGMQIIARPTDGEM